MATPPSRLRSRMLYAATSLALTLGARAEADVTLRLSQPAYEVGELVSTLVEIIEGVNEAQATAAKAGAAINAQTSGKFENPVYYKRVGAEHRKGPYETYVEFDVAVTAAEENQASSGVSGGISVLPFRVGAKMGASESEANSTMSRIRFRVLVVNSLPGVAHPTSQGG